MCGYSLQNQFSRKARQGDRLITCIFPKTLCVGFCDPNNPELAICLTAGTEIAFESPIKYTGFWGIGLHSNFYGATLARFREIPSSRSYPPLDAIELENGGITLLQNLRAGQIAEVLQLPAHENRMSADFSSIILENNAISQHAR